MTEHTDKAENDENDDRKDHISIHHFLKLGLLVTRARIVQHHLKFTSAIESTKKVDWYSRT